MTILSLAIQSSEVPTRAPSTSIVSPMFDRLCCGRECVSFCALDGVVLPATSVSPRFKHPADDDDDGEEEEGEEDNDAPSAHSQLHLSRWADSDADRLSLAGDYI